MSAAAGIITAIGSTIAAGAGAYTAGSAPAKSRKQQERQKELMALQNQYSQENAKEQYERQMALYERAYQDESYANRVKQMKEAGLNVGLMYSGGAGGGGGAGTIGQVGGAGAPSGGQAPSAAAEADIQQRGARMTLDALQQAANIKLTRAQAANVEEDTGLKREQKGETTTRAELNAETISWVKSREEGQKLQNKFDEVRNEIQGATKGWQIEKVKYEVEVLFEDAETAYERKLQAVEETERKQQTTNDYVRQMAIMTKNLAMEWVQRNIGVELTEAQIEGIFRGLELTAEGNDIKWNENKIREELGKAGIDQTEKNTVIGTIGSILQAGFSVWGTTRIAKAMMGAAKTSAGAKSIGKNRVVTSYNGAGELKGWTVLDEMNK